MYWLKLVYCFYVEKIIFVNQWKEFFQWKKIKCHQEAMQILERRFSTTRQAKNTLRIDALRKEPIFMGNRYGKYKSFYVDVTIYNDDVTGSCMLIHVHRPEGDEYILIDCGVYLGDKAQEDKNFKPFLFNPNKLSAVIMWVCYLCFAKEDIPDLSIAQIWLLRCFRMYCLTMRKYACKRQKNWKKSHCLRIQT